MITGEDGEQSRLPANELEIFFFVLAFAGSDTTKNALGYTGGVLDAHHQSRH